MSAACREVTAPISGSTEVSSWSRPISAPGMIAPRLRRPSLIAFFRGTRQAARALGGDLQMVFAPTRRTAPETPPGFFRIRTSSRCRRLSRTLAEGGGAQLDPGGLAVVAAVRRRSGFRP